jgi:hypothetical protein
MHALIDCYNYTLTDTILYCNNKILLGYSTFYMLLCTVLEYSLATSRASRELLARDNRVILYSYYGALNTVRAPIS